MKNVCLTHWYRQALLGAVVAALTACAAVQAPAQTSITVANPGFETGDFTGWQKTPAAFGTDLRVASDNSYTGTYDAAFTGAKIGSYDSLSQSLVTVAGHSYTVNFFLKNLSYSAAEFKAPNNGFQASFAGV